MSSAFKDSSILEGRQETLTQWQEVTSSKNWMLKIDVIYKLEQTAMKMCLVTETEQTRTVWPP